MGLVNAALGAALLLAMIMTAGWETARRTGQSGWADAFWSFGVGIAGVFVALVPPGGAIERRWLAAALIGFWALRLGQHIARRAASTHEDARYADLRALWGREYYPRLFLFLQIQALCAVGLAVTVLVAAHSPRPGLDPRDGIGAAILLIAVLGEGISDRQLRRFGHDPENRGKVCDVGLWRWSRHPNYFFEWLGWLAWPVIAIDLAWWPGWLALVGPVLIYWLLARVSGVPPLEKHMFRSRGKAYADYAGRTSEFFPRPPRKRG